MENLIKSLPALLKLSGDSIEVREAACIAAWTHAAGEGLRDHAFPLGLREKTLVVAVGDQTWQKQLQPLSTQLLLRINQLLGESLVTSLEFRIDADALAQARRKQQPELDPKKVADNAIPLELATAATQIEDKDLRKAFIGAAVVCLNKLEQSKT